MTSACSGASGAGLMTKCIMIILLFMSLRVGWLCLRSRKEPASIPCQRLVVIINTLQLHSHSWIGVTCLPVAWPDCFQSQGPACAMVPYICCSGQLYFVMLAFLLTHGAGPQEGASTSSASWRGPEKQVQAFSTQICCRLSSSLNNPDNVLEQVRPPWSLPFLCLCIAAAEPDISDSMSAPCTLLICEKMDVLTICSACSYQMAC